jgi:hypothetical protein
MAMTIPDVIRHEGFYELDWTNRINNSRIITDTGIRIKSAQLLTLYFSFPASAGVLPSKLSWGLK